MLIRALAVTCLLVAPTALPVATSPAFAASEVVAPISTDELMRLATLDVVFATFAETIADSPDTQGVQLPAKMRSAWRDAALASFDAAQLQAALSQALQGQFTASETTAIADFFKTDIGMVVSATERETALLSTADQLSAHATGTALLADLPPESRRATQIGEILDLVSAEIGRAMLGSAMRAMLASMSIAGAHGDIEVPWDEIDAQLAQILPAMEAEVEASQRAVLAYAYRSLSDTELDAYVEFLRTDTARRFYAYVGFSIATIVHDAMSRFGEELATRLKQVSV